MTTFFTFIPIYLAVFSLSPTTDNSYPCLLTLRYSAISIVKIATTIIVNKWSFEILGKFAKLMGGRVFEPEVDHYTIK